jgi:hypothetical protein
MGVFTVSSATIISNVYCDFTLLSYDQITVGALL